MRGIVRSLGGLQWKLTLSYTLVTSAAVLIAMLVPILSSWQAGYRMSQYPRIIAMDVRQSASDLAPLLDDNPLNEAGVRTWVVRTTNSFGWFTTPTEKFAIKVTGPMTKTAGIAAQTDVMLYPPTNGEAYTQAVPAQPLEPSTGVTGIMPFQIPLEGEANGQLATKLRYIASPGFVAVVDPTGRILATNGEASPGEAFPAQQFPAAASVLDFALQGETDPQRLTHQDPQRDVLFVAAPVFNAQSQVLGAVLRSAPGPRSEASLLAELMRILLPTSVVVILLVGSVGTVFGFLTSRGMTHRLARLTENANAWSQGNFSAQAVDETTDELGQLARRLNHMASQIQHLMQTREELAALEERHRLAREVHDSVKQQVFAISMNLGAAQATWGNHTDISRERLDEAVKLARQAQQELTHIIQTLRPAALEEKGLGQALWEYVRDWEKQSGIHVTDEIALTDDLPGEIEQALFRVTQEALANVARHSGATTVTVRLITKPGQAQLTVIDTGRGFDVRRPAAGIGLHSMRERVEALGGQLELRSGPRGTRLSAVIPVPEETA